MSSYLHTSWSISALLMLSLIAVTTTTQSAAYAQKQVREFAPCPPGFEINKGMCEKPAVISCHGVEVRPEDGRCLVAVGGNPAEGCPEGYVPHPDFPTQACALIVDPFLQCRGMGEGLSELNRETGMCEQKPGLWDRQNDHN
jgi:hypothetical protein